MTMPVMDGEGGDDLRVRKCSSRILPLFMMMVDPEDTPQGSPPGSPHN